jgi:hypothetical protein
VADRRRFAPVSPHLSRHFAGTHGAISTIAGGFSSFAAASAAPSRPRAGHTLTMIAGCAPQHDIGSAAGPYSSRAWEDFALTGERPISRAIASVWRRRDGYDTATAVLIAVLVVLVFATFRDYAISTDERVQHHYGELIIRYYLSGFTDESLFSFDNLYLYGGLFDVVSILVAHVLPFDVFDIRHVLCGLTGVGGIAMTAMTARLVAGPRAGAIATALLATFGLWYGGMFNHTKDIPFATGMIAATYFLILAARELPRPQLRHVVAFGLALGLALGQRVTGLMVPLYVLLIIATQVSSAAESSVRQRLRFACASLFAFAPGLLIGYLIMVAFWPWSALDLFNPVRALFAFAHFNYDIATILAGHVYEMATVPRWYVPAYVLIKLPLLTWIGVICAGLAVALPQLARHAGIMSQQRRELAFIATTAVFPLLCHVIGHGPAFSGMRHFLFVAAPITVLGAFGLDTALTLLAAWRRVVAAAASLVVVAGMTWDAATLVRLHPYEYIDYNQLVGGIRGAAGRYATDYWGNIVPEAVNDLQAYLDRTKNDRRWPQKQRYSVAFCGDSLALEKRMRSDMQRAADWDRADFYIAPTHMHCDSVMPGQVIATINRLGVPIGVVKDLRPHQAMLARSQSAKPPP